MERVRLAVVVNGTGVGGAERMVGRVLTRLSTDEFDMMVFCLDSCGAVADQLKAAGIPVLGMDILKRRVPNPIDIVDLRRSSRGEIVRSLGTSGTARSMRKSIRERCD